MGTWTSQGFTAKTVENYVMQLQQVFQNAFGSDFLLDPTTPQGVLIQELAELLYNADMDSIEVINRLNLNTISGLFLDFVGSMRGVTRFVGTPSVLTVTLTSKPTTLPFTIPEGQTFAWNGGSEIFVTNTAITVTGATQNISLYSTATGKTGVAVDDVLSTNIYNITDIKVAAVSQGTEEESDIDYRNRLRQRYTAAQGTVQFLVNKLFELPCVKTVGVNYNDTDSTVDTLPPHTTEFMAVSVDGYDVTSFQNQVAGCILNYKTPNAELAGNTTVSVPDVFGETKSVSFTVPTKKDMIIEVTVSTPENGIINLTNADSIKAQIANYINTLGIGKDVSYSRCMAPLTADEGFDVATFKIKADGDAGWTTNSNYTIGTRAYASITEANISIGVS